jgi:hypothetical protein
VILRPLRRFITFWFDFVVGDDWRIAASVIAVMAAGAWLVHGHVVRTSIVAIGIGAAVIILAASSILWDGARMRSR